MREAIPPSHPLSPPVSSCPQSFPASGSFPMSGLFISGGQNIGPSAAVLPMNIQGWFLLGLTAFILQSTGLSRIFFNTTVWKLQFFGTQPSLWFNAHCFHIFRICLPWSDGTECHDLSFLNVELIYFVYAFNYLAKKKFQMNNLVIKIYLYLFRSLTNSCSNCQ